MHGLLKRMLRNPLKRPVRDLDKLARKSSIKLKQPVWKQHTADSSATDSQENSEMSKMMLTTQPRLSA